jgi:hypothetical protein
MPRYNGLTNEGDSKPVPEFENEYVVANLKRWDHGSRGDLKGLNNRSTDTKRERKDDHKRFSERDKLSPQGGFLWLLGHTPWYTRRVR